MFIFSVARKAKKFWCKHHTVFSAIQILTNASFNDRMKTDRFSEYLIISSNYPIIFKYYNIRTLFEYYLNIISQYPKSRIYPN